MSMLFICTLICMAHVYSTLTLICMAHALHTHMNALYMFHMIHMCHVNRVGHDAFICATGGVMSHIWVRRVWHDAFICAPGGVMSHIWVRHVSGAEWVSLCLTYEWVMSHIWRSQVSPMGSPNLVFRMPHSCLRYRQRLMYIRDAFLCETWLKRDMTPSHMWHNSFICVTWRIYMRDTTHSYVWHTACICVPWLTHICDTTHALVWQDTFIRAMSTAPHAYPRRISMRDMTHSYA